MQGLNFLHSHGVIVMDIKPDNIFCNRTGSFQIGDFGMAVVSSLNWVCLAAPSAAPVYTGICILQRRTIASCAAECGEVAWGHPAASCLHET